MSHIQRHEDEWPMTAFRNQSYWWVLEQRDQHGALTGNTRTGTRNGRSKVVRWDLDGWILTCNPEATRDRHKLQAAGHKLLRLYNRDKDD